MHIVWKRVLKYVLKQLDTSIQLQPNKMFFILGWFLSVQITEKEQDYYATYTFKTYNKIFTKIIKYVNTDTAKQKCFYSSFVKTYCSKEL